MCNTLIAYCLVYQNSHGATVDEKHNITVQLEGYDQLICTKHRLSTLKVVFQITGEK